MSRGLMSAESKCVEKSGPVFGMRAKLMFLVLMVSMALVSNVSSGAQVKRGDLPASVMRPSSRGFRSGLGAGTGALPAWRVMKSRRRFPCA